MPDLTGTVTHTHDPKVELPPMPTDAEVCAIIREHKEQCKNMTDAGILCWAPETVACVRAALALAEKENGND